MEFELYYSTSKLKSKLLSFSPQANCTDRGTASCPRSQSQILLIEDVAWSAQQIPTDINLDLLDLEQLHFYSSSSSVILTRLTGPCSRLTISQKIW
jgi:hypothetical protein